jgi:hypothetical protein
MRSFRFRPRLDRFEERLTPAAGMSDVLAAAAQTMAGANFFRAVATDPDWMFNPANQSFVQAKLQSIVDASQAATTTFSGVAGGWSAGGMAAVAQANQAMAEQIGGWLGLHIAPIVVTPITPAPRPTDAGMTDTMPDPNAADWVPLGAQGLKTWDVVVGTGTPVAAGQSITVFYTGWLAANGTKFDSRRSPAAPATFALTGLIQGWQQGIPGMKPGGIRRLFVPAALGYGAAGSGSNIPPNADLVFEIKLVSHH